MTKPRDGAMSEHGAGNETRTRDLNLGKVALYQLSYSRIGCHDTGSPELTPAISHLISLF